MYYNACILTSIHVTLGIKMDPKSMLELTTLFGFVLFSQIGHLSMSSMLNEFKMLRIRSICC